MKLAKKVLSLVLVLTLMSVLVIPAAALETQWRSEFRNYFPTLSQGSSYTGYVGALRRFLYVYPATTTAIINSGGIDGSFGSGTGNAVKLFQAEVANNLIEGMTVDGIVGEKTWTCIAILLQLDGDKMEYNDNAVMKIVSSSLQYMNRYGGYIHFHTIVGDGNEI